VYTNKTGHKIPVEFFAVPFPKNPREYPYVPYIETRIIDLHFATDSLALCLFNFFLVGSVKRFYFWNCAWRFSRSRSSKVIEFGTNRKRVCDFLLVRNSNLRPILHRFGDIPAFMCSWPHPYSTLILGVFPLHQIAHVRVIVSRELKLFGREIIFEVFQLYVMTVPERYRQMDGRTDRQTDRQTTCNVM